MKRLLPLALLMCLLLPMTALGESVLLEDGTSVTVHENGVLLSSRWSDTLWYGTLTLGQDGTLPETYEELIALLDTTDWAYLTQDAKLPRMLSDGSSVTDWYREGTPVKLLADESDGSILAAVCGGETQVRVPGELLAPADMQYEQDDFIGIWLNQWQLSAIQLPKDAAPVTLYARPGGQALHTLPQGAAHRLLLLANCAEDGWLHISCKHPIIDGYVHIDDLPQNNDDVASLRLLPDYLNLGGSVGKNACGFIMRNPQNETVFVGAERLDNDTWRFTESKPLPSARISFDSGHSYDGEYIVFSVLNEEATALYGMDQWTEYIVSLEMGQWLLGTIYDQHWMDFSASPMICVQDVGTFFGSVTFDRNVATLDWNTLPENVEELLAGLDESWAVLKGDMTLLPAPGDTIPMSSYHAGTPVQIRHRLGVLTEVSVLGTSVTGWLLTEDLAFGLEQLVTVEYVTSEGETDSYEQTLMDQLPWFDVPQGTQVYAEPNGDVDFVTEYEDSFPLLGTTGNWLHLYLGGTESGFVRMEE